MMRTLAASIVVALVACVAPVHAAGTAESCAAAKAGAAGKKFLSIAKCHAKAFKKSTSVDSECVGKAITKFTEAYAKIEAKGGCGTTGDVDEIEAKVDACVIDVVTDVAPPNCGNGLQEGVEECDDGDADETDGCTTACLTAAVCTSTAAPGGDAFAVDPENGHCYVSFRSTATSWYQANDSCSSFFGYLVSITSAAEDALVHSIQGPDTPWIGGNDINVEGTFEWFSGEPFSYTHYIPGQPDDALGNQDCLYLGNTAGEWADLDCFNNAVGYICELE